MALLLNAVAEKLSRTTGLPAPTAYSICGWSKQASAFSGYNIAAIFTNAGGSENHGIGYITDLSSFCIFDASASAVFTTPDAGSGEWYWWAMVSNGSTIAGYYARVGDAAIEAQSFAYSTIATPSAFIVGNDLAGAYLNGACANVKIWDAALTAAEIARERWVARPARMANLHLWSPLHVNAADYSGGARDWTVGGSPTYEDGPPVGWGAAPLIMGQPVAATGPDYGTPYDHNGVWPFSSIWRPARV